MKPCLVFNGERKSKKNGSNDKKLSLLPYSYCHPFLLLCLKVTPLFPSTKKAGYLPTFAKTSLYMDFSAMHTVPNIVSIPSIFALKGVCI